MDCGMIVKNRQRRQIMNLNQLHYFVTLAHMEHYTNAAQKLSITQPSLSHAISSLEEELGTSLFERQGRNVGLTKYGRLFMEYAEEALDILDAGIKKTKAMTSEKSGKVDIGYIYTQGSEFIPELVSGFLEANRDKQVDFGFSNGITKEIVQGVKEEKYDIGFCSMVDDMPDLVFVPITYQELIAIVQNNHPLADRGAMYLSDLNGYRLTTYRDTIPIGKVVYKLLKKKGVEAVYSYDDEISIAGRISNSSKVAIVADTPFLRQFSNLSKVRLLDVPKDTRMIYMVYSSKNFITSAVEAFANFMVAHCLNMPE